MDSNNFRDEDINNKVFSMENFALDKDSTFLFRCDKCGKCCKNREDILLNPYDLHRVATALGMNEQDFVHKYCILFIRHDSGLPCIVLKSVGKEKACPLLNNHKCIVHRSKPTICALFPLGRGVKYSTVTHEFERVTYFHNMSPCGRKDEKHTVQEWIDKFNLGESEEFFGKWSASLVKLTEIMRDMEKYFEKGRESESMQMLYNAILFVLYFNYTPDCDFMKTYEENMSKIMKVIEDTYKVTKENLTKK